MKYDVSTLPKWAQAKIELLERDLEYAKAKLLEGPEDSDTFADPYYGGLDSRGRPLGKGALIRFHVGPKYYEHIDVQISGYGVQIHGGFGIRVRPGSGNLVHVELDR